MPLPVTKKRRKFETDAPDQTRNEQLGRRGSEVVPARSLRLPAAGLDVAVLLLTGLQSQAGEPIEPGHPRFDGLAGS